MTLIFLFSQTGSLCAVALAVLELSTDQASLKFKDLIVSASQEDLKFLILLPLCARLEAGATQRSTQYATLGTELNLQSSCLSFPNGRLQECATVLPYLGEELFAAGD